jgi:aryl-alcohol dehydrogenase-like predicted oxidoreductase
MITQTKLGETGLKVGRLGLGTWELGVQKINVPTVKQMIGQMLDSGANLIDTSDNYNGAENILGEAIKDFNRDDLVIVTKCGDYTDVTFDPKTGLSTNHPAYKYAHLNFSPKVIKRNVEDSLRNLKIDCIDVLLIHTCFLDKLQQGDVIDAIIRAKEEGKARFIGYSGDNAEIIYSAQIPEFSVLELSLSIADIRNGYVPLQIAKENKMGIIVKRPIANAFWRKDIYLPAFVYAQNYRNRTKKMQLKPSQFGLPNNNDGWVELALSFTHSLPIDVMAVGTTRLDHMNQNINIISKLGKSSQTNIVDGVIDKFCNAQKKIRKYSQGKIWLGLE